jgi:Mn-containing catalase
MTREVAHQKSFEKALYAMEPNFPAGKLGGLPDFADKYYDMSQGEGDARGPWNEGDQWEFVDDREAQGAVDGGDGSASVGLSDVEIDSVKAFALRTASDPTSNPVTGADLGAGPGAGSTTPFEVD